MSRYSSFGALLVLLVGPAYLAAQQPTTVQLPEFRYFTVQTTVSVPDSGRGFLGGVNRAGSSRVTRGTPLGGLAGPLGRSTAIGSERSTSSVGVHATIIDHAAMDRAVLDEAARRRALGSPLMLADPATRRKADFLSRNVGHASDIPLRNVESHSEPRLPSVAEIRRQNDAAAQRRFDEAAAYVEKSRQLVADGKNGAAKIYLRMAAERADGEFKDEILAQLEAIEGGFAVRRIASSRD